MNSRGFTLFEFAVSATVLGALAATLLSRSLFYQQEAERVAVQQLVATLRTALQVRVSKVGSKAGAPDAMRLVEENPLDWLARKPDNYLGEFYSPEVEKMPGGNWVFDRRDKTLVYLLSSHKSFNSSTSKLLKFKVESVHLAVKAGAKNGPAEAPQAVVLHQVSDEAATSTN